MASVKDNKNGLGRYISADTRRQVRQRDGFGCVKCGSGFYQYDHLGVEFAEADLHDPDKIVLLCGGCHDRKTRGNLSTETILQHAKNPKCKQKGFSWGAFDIGGKSPEVILGTLTVNSSQNLLRIHGEDVFSIAPPESEGQPYRVNAKFYDKKGRLTLEIIDNETRAAITNWDVELEGPRLTIRSRLREFDLAIRTEPPHRLVIERLDMIYKDFSIQCREGHPTTIERAGQVFVTGSGEFSGCESIIGVDEHGMGIGYKCESMVLRSVAMSSHSALSRVPPSKNESKSPRSPYPVRVSNASVQSRNSVCACGSGKKFKRCHGQIS